MENLDSSHNSGRHQSGWDHDNQDGKQVEVSSDLKQKVARSDGHQGEWNQNDRTAKEDKLIRAVSSASNKLENQATDSIGDIAKKTSEDQSQHYDAATNMVSATGSGSQPNLERVAAIQKYPGGDTHLQGHWQANDNNINSHGAHGNWRVSIHKDQQSNIAASGTWNAEDASHGSDGMEQSDQGQNGRNRGQNGQQGNMSASGNGVQQNALKI